MKRISEEKGSTFSTTIILMIAIGGLAIYGIYLCWQTINDARADEIINNVLIEAELERNRLVSEGSPNEEGEANITQNYKTEQKGYSFMVKEGATPALVKVETGKRAITPGVCKALKKKFKEPQWKDVFKKVLIIDRMGEERTDILVYNCSKDRIPALRFYVRFVDTEEVDLEPVSEEPDVTESKLPPPSPLPAAAPTSSPSPSVKRPTYSYSRSSSTCPSGTSSGGMGGIATAGCRCNGLSEFWNGKSCEVKNCPAGSSKGASATGDKTNVPGCRCNTSNPIWTGERCISRCSGNKVLENGKCVCPHNMVMKKGDPNYCVECNEDSNCFSGMKCVKNKCVGKEENCRWGVCQTCDINGKHLNIEADQTCETGGLPGLCNGNGTCYPTRGRRCISVRGCPSGQFCNYGGTFNSSKKQKGKFGQTPDVCQAVAPQEFVYKKVTYYYNSEEDLKSWCRAANNKANCLWGYLAKSGAESWCFSLGKRLLTRAEMADVWDELKKELPQTYTGYSYWVQEGAWLEDKQGRRSFGKGTPDGFGGKGGVVCR